MPNDFEFDERRTSRATDGDYERPRRKPQRTPLVYFVFVGILFIGGIVAAIILLKPSSKEGPGTGTVAADADQPKVDGKQPKDKGTKLPRKQETPVQDFKEFTEKLKKDVPIEREAFVKMGLKAERYEMDTFQKDEFLIAILKIDPPVKLHDKVTGETREYTRARMVRNYHPIGGRNVVSYANYWETVEMLP